MKALKTLLVVAVILAAIVGETLALMKVFRIL